MGCLTIETWLLFITNVFGLSLYFLYFCLYHLERYFMKEIKLETKIRIYSLAELPEEESRLMEAAIKATGQSYAPYSKFHVEPAVIRRMPLTLPVCVRSEWHCFMPAINIRICLLSLLPLQPPRMAGRSRAFPLAVHAARFCWRRNNAMASR